MNDTPEIHARHCCPVCGCKYGDPDCPVYNGKVKVDFDGCENCDNEYYGKQKYIVVWKDIDRDSYRVLKNNHNVCDNKVKAYEYVAKLIEDSDGMSYKVEIVCVSEYNNPEGSGLKDYLKRIHDIVI